MAAYASTIAARPPGHSVITRRACLSLASTCGTVSPLFIWAQSATRLPRVALVWTVTPIGEMTGADPVNILARDFLHRLRDLGYVEGRNIIVERRSAEGQPERLPVLMKELVGLPVDVIVTTGTGAAEAMRATSTIPIVALVDDPVEVGLTASLARPSGNITGVTSSPSLAINSKRLQLLKEAAPKSARVAMIDFKYINSRETPGTHQRRRELEASAREMGLTLIPVGVDKPEDFEPAFATIAGSPADALIAMDNLVNWRGRRAIIDFAARQRLPAIYSDSDFTEAGGLMSYASATDPVPALAAFVDKILKGAKPAELPWEQPTKFELTINLKAAKALGLTIPLLLLLRADKVIK
jgi:putative ABC transport system substrate-binding protein